MAALTAPALLDGSHRFDGFDCGERSLNEWLQRHARRNQASGAARTFVVTDTQRVVGYYCLATGSVAHRSADTALRRNMPDPIPVLILGRLVVDKSFQAAGLGRDLLRDAVLRTLLVAEQVGVRALLVHALSERARQFYLRNGFRESGIEPMTLTLGIAEVAKQLAL